MTEPWRMENAKRAAMGLGASTCGRVGASHSIYVLLHNPARTQPWGLYVGQTSRDPDWRFDQHKLGHKVRR